MKHNLTMYFVFAGIVISFSGCGRVVDWAKDSFYQGQSSEQYAEAPREYTQSTVVYDQLTTLGRFDAMWLADAVRAAYARSHAQKYGLNKDLENALLRRQLEENRHFIVFYVLANNKVPLSDTAAEWAFSLHVGDKVFVPSEIKEIDLNPEYRAFFGKKYNRFKIAYCVKFDAHDSDDHDILSDNVEQMVLRMASLKKQATLTWNTTRHSENSTDQIELELHHEIGHSGRS